MRSSRVQACISSRALRRFAIRARCSSNVSGFIGSSCGADIRVLYRRAYTPPQAAGSIKDEGKRRFQVDFALQTIYSSFQPKLAMDPERILRKTRDLLDYYSRSVPKMQELALKKRCLRLSKIRPRRRRRDGLYKTPCAALQYAPIHWNRCFSLLF